MKMLLVIDMQEDFVNGVFGTSEAKAIVPKVAEYIKNFDGTVAYTADVHGDGDMDEVYASIQYLETKLLPEHCKAGTPGCKIVPEISDLIPDLDDCMKNDYLFLKNTFGCKDFANRLNYVDEIELCGLCTDICVINNALILRNFHPAMKITVLKDLCAGTTPENHQKALDIMKVNLIEVK